MKKLNKMITKISTGLDHILIPHIDEESLQIIAFSDASFANVPPDKEHSGKGFVVFLADKFGNASLLNWKSKKIKRVVHSTESAECLSLVDCIGDAYYNRSLVEEILFRNK